MVESIEPSRGEVKKESFMERIGPADDRKVFVPVSRARP
jgi:hypothetical protein